MHNVRNEALLIKFGDHIRKLRKEKNMTQEELAYKSGLALSQIARIETGRLNTSISTIFVLADALKVPSFELLRF